MQFVLNNIGRIHQVCDQSGLTEFSSYDFKGNPLEQKKKFCQSYDAPVNWVNTNNASLLQTQVFITQWTYNTLNQPLLITLPDGSSQQNTYNKAGLLETVSSNGQAYVSNINYNEKGQRSKMEFGNNTQTEYFYEAKTFRLMQLLTTRNSNTQNPLQDLRYTYDPVGNIVEIYDASKETSYYKNSVIEPRHQFTYDALYRLLSGTGRELLGLAQATSGGYAANSAGAADAKALHTYTQNFAYDELGNIKSIQHQTNTSTLNWTRNYVYDTVTNRLLKHDNNQTLPDYTYDEHGNITKMPHLQSMHYDYKDQLNSVLLDASENTAYYIYDANGQRVRKVIEKGNVREERIYVGSYERYIKTENGSQTIERISVSIAEVAEEPREEEGDSRAVYQIDLNKRIALIEYIEGQSPTIRYQLGNHLGSASLELDATGQIISYEEFHPFGTTSYRSGTNETEVSLKRYKYIGKERDEETGLYYYGARYYAAWIGRFESVDPLAEKYLNLSPYVYVADNPIKYIDPDGKDSIMVNQKGVVTNRIAADGDHRLFTTDKDGNVSELFVNDGSVDQDLLGRLRVDDQAVYFLTEENINWLMETAGIPGDVDIFMGTTPGFTLGAHGGDFDFSATILWGNAVPGHTIESSQDADSWAKFFVFGGGKTAYNIMDAGNWLWGHAGSRLGYDKLTLQIGSNTHSLITNGAFDSKADQRSIMSGASFNTLHYNKTEGFYRLKAVKPSFVDLNNSAIRGRRKEKLSK